MANPLYDSLFAKHAGKSKVFITLADGTQWSYQDFLSLAARYANVFASLDLVAGDRVAVQVGKSVNALAVYAACAQAGLVFLPLNTAYKADEVSYFVENSGAKLLIADPKNEATLAPIASACDAKLETMDGAGAGSFAKRAATMSDSFETVERSGDDLAAFLYTSGTTGRSKGAMLTQNNLLSNCEALIETWRFSEEDHLLHALPIFHTHGLFVASNVILNCGASMIFLPKFDLDQMIELLPKVNTMMGVPTFYTRLLSDDRFQKPLVEHMRLFISGSAPLLAETHVQFEERTGHRILERYGMTETNMNTSNPYDGARIAGTVGTPLPGVEVKITHEKTGETLLDGDIGMVEVRGPNVFKGYWQMPEKTKAELRDDGFFITGDLGKIDENGYLQIVGRDKDMIISGGYNIYPKELELILDDQPHVLESAVIGVPHPDFGETPVAVLVANTGESVDLDFVAGQLSDALARFKHPQKYVCVEELPRNTMGKVQKNVLRDQYKHLFST